MAMVGKFFKTHRGLEKVPIPRNEMSSLGERKVQIWIFRSQCFYVDCIENLHTYGLAFFKPLYHLIYPFFPSSSAFNAAWRSNFCSSARALAGFCSPDQVIQSPFRQLCQIETPIPFSTTSITMKGYWAIVHISLYLSTRLLVR